MKALTLWQPWASWVFEAGKDVENREWSTGYRGPLAIHAGQGLDRFLAWRPSSWPSALQRLIETGRIDPRQIRSRFWPRGVVLGTVDLIDCVRDHPSAWAVPGQWHWVLQNPRPLPRPVPARGQPGLWEWHCPEAEALTVRGER